MPSQNHQSAIESNNAFMVKIEDLVREVVIQNDIPYYRIESRMELHTQTEAGDIYLPVIRIVTYFEDTVGQISDIIRTEFDVEIEKSVDKKKNRLESFSYKHVQYIAGLRDNRRQLTEYKRSGNKKFEIQVCSMLQDAWAGIEKELGYDGASFPEETKRDFYRVGALLEMADIEFLKIRIQLGKHQASAPQQQPDVVIVNETKEIAQAASANTFAEHLQAVKIEAPSVAQAPEPIVANIIPPIVELPTIFVNANGDLNGIIPEINTVSNGQSTAAPVPAAQQFVPPVVFRTPAPAQPQFTPPIAQAPQGFVPPVVNHQPAFVPPVVSQPQVIAVPVAHTQASVAPAPQPQAIVTPVVNNLPSVANPIVNTQPQTAAMPAATPPQAVVNQVTNTQPAPSVQQKPVTTPVVNYQPANTGTMTERPPVAQPIIAATAQAITNANGRPFVQAPVLQSIAPQRVKVPMPVSVPSGIAPQRIKTPTPTPIDLDSMDMNVSSLNSLAMNVNNIEHKTGVTDGQLAQIVNMGMNNAPKVEPVAPVVKEEPAPPVAKVEPVAAPEVKAPAISNNAQPASDAVALNIDNVHNFNMSVNGMIERTTEIVRETPKIEEKQAEKIVPFFEDLIEPVNKPAVLDENAPMTDASLREYVMNSKLLKEVDLKIAERAGAKINAEIDIEGDVERLRFLKVFTLKQLHDRIMDNKNDIVAFAEKWIGKDNGGSFDSGISLFYLEYLLVGKKNDPAFAIEYVVKFISDNDYSARYIIPTYNSIKNTEMPNFSHLTLKA